MNYAQSFEEFSKSVTTLDLALYAGAGLVIWVLFKEKLSPVQQFIASLVSKAKNSLPAIKTTEATVTPVTTVVEVDQSKLFFDLIASWKQTRDLAIKSNCPEAVKVVDQMFPYLSPTVCGSNKENN